ncbi:MAG: ferritin [Oscillospiraceae bacterium]|jgi:ferritin
MLSQTLTKAISEQVNAEYYSAYLYLAMSAACDRMGFKGFANWMHVQAQEEMAHGTHMFEHLLDRGAAPAFGDIKAPPSEYSDLREIFEKTLAHEEMVTGLINKLASLAMQENDHATYNFLQWYINEQVEEESTASLILQKLNFIGDNASMLYALDTEMAARTFVDPFAAQGA